MRIILTKFRNFYRDEITFIRCQRLAGLASTSRSKIKTLNVRIIQNISEDYSYSQCADGTLRWRHRYPVSFSLQFSTQFPHEIFISGDASIGRSWPRVGTRISSSSVNVTRRYGLSSGFRIGTITHHMIVGFLRQ